MSDQSYQREYEQHLEQRRRELEELESSIDMLEQHEFSTEAEERATLLEFDNARCLGLTECNSPEELAALTLEEIRLHTFTVSRVLLDRSHDAINSQF